MLASQTVTNPSWLPEARYFPSGLNATPRPPPDRVKYSLPVTASQTLTSFGILSIFLEPLMSRLRLPPQLEVAKRFPSGLKATPLALIAWPRKL